MNGAWWLKTTTSVLRRLRWGDDKFKANLGYIGDPVSKDKTTKSPRPSTMVECLSITYKALHSIIRSRKRINNNVWAGELAQ